MPPDAPGRARPHPPADDGVPGGRDNRRGAGLRACEYQTSDYEGFFSKGSSGGSGLCNESFAGAEACATVETLSSESITFSASGPNADGVVTELLLCRMKGRHRKPNLKDYRTQAFVAFAPGSLEATIAAAPGVYGCAIRFVRAATGQETAILPLGVVEVAAY